MDDAAGTALRDIPQALPAASQLRTHYNKEVYDGSTNR